jgi:hypothetical protein
MFPNQGRDINKSVNMGYGFSASWEMTVLNFKAITFARPRRVFFL